MILFSHEPPRTTQHDSSKNLAKNAKWADLGEQLGRDLATVRSRHIAKMAESIRLETRDARSMIQGSRDARLSESHDSERQSLPDLVALLYPAIAVLAATLLASFFAGTAEIFLLVQSSGRILARFLAITAILLAPLLIMPSFISFLGMTLANELPFGSIVRGEARVQFSRSLLWGIRPLQGIGVSFMFVNQLLNLFRTYPETSFVSALVRPVLFIIVSIPFSMLFSAIWSLDDLGVKIYLKNTGEVRLIGGYVGTILPVVSGAFGIYSLLQHGFSPTDALVMLTLVALVLYPPYVLFAVVHSWFLGRRRTRLIESLRFASVEVHMSERLLGGLPEISIIRPERR